VQAGKALALVGAFAVHGDDDHAEALSEIDLTECQPGDGGVGCHDALDECTFVGGNRLEAFGEFGLDGDALHRVRLSHAGGATGEHKAVAVLQFLLGRIACDGDPVAHYFEQADTAFF